jgi:hypothetical protein
MVKFEYSVLRVAHATGEFIVLLDGAAECPLAAHAQRKSAFGFADLMIAGDAKPGSCAVRASTPGYGARS